MIDGVVVYRYSPRAYTIYLNVTNRCSNSCNFCVKNYTSGLSGYQLWLSREPALKEVWTNFEEEVKSEDREVVWCGFGEPTIRLNLLLDVTKMIRKKYPPLKIRLDTDGLAQLRNRKREVAKELKDAGIDSISISLNAENEEKYNQICRPSQPGSYQALLKFTKDCKKYFTKVRLTVVDIKNIDITKCKRIAQELDCDFVVR